MGGGAPLRPPDRIARAGAPALPLEPYLPTLAEPSVLNASRAVLCPV
jgi:hypothetical protein